MRVSQERMAENHERILDAATRLFREHGFDGIGVADVMKAAGMTHGGFYGHFASKEALMEAASGRAVDDFAQRWETLATENPDDAAAALTRTYLSRRHCDALDQGCPVAALAIDAPRQAPAVRRRLTDGLRGMIGRLSDMLPGRTRAVRRQAAVAHCASMVGALVLARMVDDAAFSKEILNTVAASLLRSDPKREDAR